MSTELAICLLFATMLYLRARVRRRIRSHSLLYDSYLHSQLWRARRWQWIAQARGRCQHCGHRGDLTVHHLTYARLGRERDEDVQVLCWPCHHARHHTPRRR
jgi:5-methylcytosine-specific restriction endonuclease McrA